MAQPAHARPFTFRVRFRTALTRVINRKLPPGPQRARIFNALARPIPGQQNRFGYALVYGQCCTEMIDTGTVVETILQTLRAVVDWLIANWDKVLKLLLSLILFI